MSRIVAGRFDRVLNAQDALEALKTDGFSDGEVELFYVAPPGQHDRNPLGGDGYSDAGARFGGRGALVGGLVGAGIGLALGTFLSLVHGLIAVLLMMGLGAYVGSFVGAMSRMRDYHNADADADSEHPTEQPAGTMLAINVDRAGTVERAVAALRQHGAHHIGSAQGRWTNGSWRDFDPSTRLGAV